MSEIIINKLKQLPMMFSVKNAVLMGLEKSIMFWNIDDFSKTKEEIYENFKFIDKEKFMKIFDELKIEINDLNIESEVREGLKQSEEGYTVEKESFSQYA